MPQPNKIPRPFADSGDKNSIPDSSGSIGFASWQEGFPAITSEPFAQGGVAPKRADFNGIFNALSAAIVWNQQGGVYAYDVTTDYEVGNVVEYNNDLYRCLAANGPSSAVKAPTDTTVWSKVMTAADVAALYLPLSGGTMSGNLSFSQSSARFIQINKDGDLRLYGASNSSYGASLMLSGMDSPSTGAFSISANDGNTGKTLFGRANGGLFWDGKVVPVIQTGTWTPVLEGSTVTGVLTYAEQYGWYEKINDLVYVVGKIDVSGYTTLPTGTAVIRGLPYSATNASARYFGGANGMDGLDGSFNIISGVTFLGNTSSLNIFVNSRTTIGKTRYYAEFTSNPANNEFGIALAQSSQRIYFNCLYRTA